MRAAVGRAVEGLYGFAGNGKALDRDVDGIAGGVVGINEDAGDVQAKGVEGVGGVGDRIEGEVLPDGHAVAGWIEGGAEDVAGKACAAIELAVHACIDDFPALGERLRGQGADERIAGAGDVESAAVEDGADGVGAAPADAAGRAAPDAAGGDKQLRGGERVDQEGGG